MVATWNASSGSSRRAFSAEALRRATNRRRSTSCEVQPGGALMNTCSMRGSDSAATSPSTEVSIGTSRHPATSRVSSRIFMRRIWRERLAIFGSRLRNTMPTAKSWSSQYPSSAATARKNSLGNAIRTPQPSPVFPSAAIAPLWVMRFSAVQAVRTRSWLASPRICAIRPKPQLSLALSGWYSPLFSPGHCMTHKFLNFRAFHCCAGTFHGNDNLP